MLSCNAFWSSVISALEGLKAVIVAKPVSSPELKRRCPVFIRPHGTGSPDVVTILVIILLPRV